MKAVVLDTETTGLISNRAVANEHQPEVIEFFACLADLKAGKVIKEYHTLIKPQKYPMSQQVIEETRTKLSNAMLLEAPHFADVADNIRKIIENATCVIAHNAAFDQEMLDIEYDRLGGKPMTWPRMICTVEQSAHLKGRRLNLTDLHTLLTGKPFSEAHRAKNDVMALVNCAKIMFKRGML